MGECALDSKKKFIDRMYEIINYGGVKRFTKENCRIGYNVFVTTVMLELEEGRDVPLQGIGDFYIEKRPAHIGHDPRTMKKMHVPSYRYIRFKPTPRMRRVVKELTKYDKPEE